MVIVQVLCGLTHVGRLKPDRLEQLGLPCTWPLMLKESSRGSSSIPRAKSQCVGAHVLMTLLAEESHGTTFRANPGGATQGQGHWEAGLTGTISVTIYHSPIQNSLEYEQHAWGSTDLHRNLFYGVLGWFYSFRCLLWSD